MVIRVTYIFIGVILMSLMIDCSPSNSKAEEHPEVNYPQNPVQVKYSRGFEIDTAQGFQVLLINDPVTGIAHEYYLVPKGMDGPSDKVIIPTPVNNLSLFSVSFIGFLDAIDRLASIKYIENINYVYNEEVHSKFENGEILESGSLGQINLEKLILDAPELIVLNDFPESSTGLDKLVKYGVNVLPIIEWHEDHPLARAEWIKVFGALLDEEVLANAVFDEVVENYEVSKEQCAGASSSVKVIFSSLYQGVWYMPGGKSYLAHLLSDANGIHAWAENESTGSVGVSFEEVILSSEQNDVWINPNANSISELYSMDGRYKTIVDKLTLGAYQANSRVHASGGNDYWESGVVRPDKILSDYAKMLFPEKFKELDLYYFTKLK